MYTRHRPQASRRGHLGGHRSGGPAGGAPDGPVFRENVWYRRSGHSTVVHVCCHPISSSSAYSLRVLYTRRHDAWRRWGRAKIALLMLLPGFFCENPASDALRSWASAHLTVPWVIFGASVCVVVGLPAMHLYSSRAARIASDVGEGGTGPLCAYSFDGSHTGGDAGLQRRRRRPPRRRGSSRILSGEAEGRGAAEGRRWTARR
jgi:hypothetical protein